MSLYNAMFGMHPTAALALALVRHPHHDFPRFRDAWVQPNPETGEPEVRIHTRMGGGNAECWEQYSEGYDFDAPCDCAGCHITDVVPTFDRFIRMEDDEFDSTYRDIYFAPLPDEVEVARSIMESNPVNLREKWEGLMERLEKGELTEREEAASKQIVESLSEAWEKGQGGVVEI